MLTVRRTEPLGPLIRGSNTTRRGQNDRCGGPSTEMTEKELTEHASDSPDSRAERPTAARDAAMSTSLLSAAGHSPGQKKAENARFSASSRCVCPRVSTEPHQPGTRQSSGCGLGKSTRHLTPVHHVPKACDVVGTAILVIEVVCVFPDVQAKNGSVPDAERSVLIGSALDHQ